MSESSRDQQHSADWWGDSPLKLMVTFVVVAGEGVVETEVGAEVVAVLSTVTVPPGRRTSILLLADRR